MKKLFFLLFIFKFIFSFGQISISVKDEMGKPIPYATVLVKTPNFITSTDINGMAKIPATNDSIFVTHTSYQPIQIPGKGNNELNITLKRYEKELSPIVVLSCEKFKKVKESNIDESASHAGLALFNNASAYTVGLLFQKSRNPPAYIKSISFEITGWGGSGGVGVGMPYSFELFEYDTARKLPGNSLLGEPIIYKPLKKGRQKFELPSNIVFPKNGLVIAFTQLPAPEYEFYFTAHKRDSITGIDSVYQVQAMGTSINSKFANEKVFARNIRTNEWEVVTYKYKNNTAFLNPEYELELKYCN